MNLIKRKWQPNHRWQAFLWFFSIILCFPVQVLSNSNPFFLTNLGTNQIPIALSDNGAILIEDRSDQKGNTTRYIIVNGVEIRAPEGAIIEGLNEVGDKAPLLTLVGRAPGLFDKFQANQWQLIGAGLNPIETAKWKSTSLSLPDETLPNQIIGINTQGTVLGQRASTTGDLELFYIDIDSEGRRHFNPPVYRNFPLSDYPQSEARAINATGDIVGVLTDTNGTKHSYVYRQNKGAGDIIPNTLSTDNYLASEALALSDRGPNSMIWVVGRTQIGADRWQAYVATDNSMTAINTDILNGGNSVAKSVNNAGNVVGQATNSEGQNRAFLYHIDEDTFVDLTNHPGRVFGSGIATDAIAINHRGTIVGTYTNNDKQYGYQLTSTEKDPSFHLKEQEISCQPTAPDCPIDFSAQAIAIDNGWMALGQYEANKVTLLQQGLDDTWFYHATLRPNDTTVNNQFGFSVDLHKKRLVVGANLDDNAGTAEDINVGAIYVYDYNNATTTWDLDQKISPNLSQVVADLKFGQTVSVYNNRMLVTTPGSSQLGFFYIKSASVWQESMINSPTDVSSSQGRMGELFAVFSNRNPIPIYPVTDNEWGTTPTLISQRNPFNEIESHGSTVAGTAGGSQTIYVYYNKHNQWHYQAEIRQPDPLGVFTLYTNTLVNVESKNTLYFYQRFQETWQFQARHTIKESEFSPDTMALNRDILAVGDSNKPIKIFSLTLPESIDVDLALTVNNPIENIASNTGNLITFDAIVTNQDLEREAWNVHLQIDLNNDQLMADESDPRCLWLAQITRVNCTLGNIPAQASIPLSITLQHQSPQLEFTIVQQGTDPQPSDNTVIIDTQYSDAKIALTVTPSRNEISPNGMVDFTLSVQNDEPESIGVLLTLNTDISVAYAGDSCDIFESPCHQVGTPTNLRYLVKVPPEQSTKFTVSLRFPSAGKHKITVNIPLIKSLPNPVTTTIQVGPNVPDIRILNGINLYLLKENQAMPALALTVRNWSLENKENGQHIDWILSQNSSSVKTGHIIEKSVSLGLLELGNYTLEVRLIDTNHGSTDFKDTLSFTVIIEPPNDVTVHWRDIPDTVILEPTIPVGLTLINNNQETPATAVKLSLSTTLVEWVETTSLPSGCELDTPAAITCQFPSLAASEQRELSFAFIGQRGTTKLSATISQDNPIDPVPSPLFKTIQIIDPIDLSIDSTWQETDARVNQTLQPIFTVTNQHPDRTATELTVSGTATPWLLPNPNAIPNGCRNNGNTWQCTIDTLAPGKTHDIQWPFIVVGSGSLDYQVTVSSIAQDDTNLDNNTQTTPITLTQPSPKITILQPSSTQTIYRYPLPSPADNKTYVASVQLHYRIDDWDQSERGIPHQVTINGKIVATRSKVSLLDITYNVIDDVNTIVIQLLGRDDKPVIDLEARMTLTVAEGSIVDLPTPLPPVNSGALGGWWLLLGMGLWGWRRLLRLSRQALDFCLRL